ncbi:hypothetical protein [Pedobacter aquatilis]|uniref:hypothetical protein n=1 Tax=Pedobacter aquatilis TaxID=351343 RepID=UPI00292E59EB|nr:hypothetical protein [Pedobacter aquatilis]
MKRFFGILIAITSLAVTAQAQKLKAANIPAPVKAAFMKLHPNVKVSWEKEKQNYEAGFSINGKETSEVYTAAGTLVETEVEIKTSELPAAVLTKLKNMKIAEAAKITRANGTIIYEAEVKGKDLLFEANGEALKP